MLLATVLLAAAAALPSAPPSSAGMSAARLGKLDAAIEDSIAKKECPGAVVLVGRHGKVVYRKAYGSRALVPAREPMTVDTVFDMASLTKVLATAPSVMTLVEDGKIRLQDRVAKFIPEFVLGGGARDQVTVEELLDAPGGPCARRPDGSLHGNERRRSSKGNIASRSPTRPAHASCTRTSGYEVLGELVERV